MTAAASDSPARPPVLPLHEQGLPLRVQSLPQPAKAHDREGRRLVLDTSGVVFCGGASARMGRDKALLVLDGKTLIARAAAVLAEVTPRVLLASGPAARYPELGLECVLDPEAGLGPLAGLCAALARLEQDGVERACVLACDMPRVDAAAFRTLLARAGEADVCLVATAAGVEPLCGVYHVRALPAARAALARGERRMDAFHRDLRLVTVPEHELGAGCARNLNTPGEMAAELAAELAAGGRTLPA